MCWYARNILLHDHIRIEAMLCEHRAMKILFEFEDANKKDRVESNVLRATRWHPQDLLGHHQSQSTRWHPQDSFS